MSHSSAVPAAGPQERSAGSVAGLVAIIAAVTLGVILGVVLGRSMWMASGGPQGALKKSLATAQQKRDFAAVALAEAEKLAAGGNPRKAEAKRARAAHLEEQAKANDKRADEYRQLVAQVEAAAGSVQSRVAHTAYTLLKFCGDLFIQVLKLLVIPLVVTSMIVGITSLGDIRRLGRLGGWTLVMYIVSMAVAVIVGITLVQTIQPGINADDTYGYVPPNVPREASALETLLNVFRGQPGKDGSGMFPSNIFMAAAETNVLALIVFALIFGGLLTTLGERGRPLVEFFRVTNEVVMKMVLLVMICAPVGIFGLVAAKIADNGGAAGLYEQVVLLGRYVGTVSLGLAIQFVLLTVAVGLLARRNPLTYLYGMLRALLTAATTASSSATLPVTMECAEVNGGISNRSASFVLPLGATINMDGTALYEAVAAVFIAQAAGIHLDMGSLLVISLTATLAAIGAAGIPEAGLFTMVIVLTAVGLPVEGIGAILAIDWFLDRLRTTVNVYGDAAVAAIIDHRIVRAEGVALTP